MKANEKPQGWQPCTFGDVLKERVEGGGQDDELLSVTNARGVIRQAESNKRDTSNANKSKYKRVYVDDIVYNTMRMWQGVSGRSSYNGIVSPAYTVCTPVAGNDSKCLAALLKHPLNVNLFRRYSQGLVDDTLSLKYDVFAQLPFILPARQEQPRIARVLDVLDAVIQHSEETIVKYKHVRVGMMHDLLTYGINEHGEIRNPLIQPEQFKDSNSILGDVPNEWDVDLLRTVLIGIDAGKSPKCLSRPAAAGEWGVLKVSAIRPEGFKADENKAITNALHINTAYEVRDGDLLISRANTYELVGSVCFVEDPPRQLMLCDKTLRLNVNSRRINAQYLSMVLQMHNVRLQIERCATGSSGSMKNIGQGDIEILVIPLPKPDEQTRIVEYIQVQNSEIQAEEATFNKLRQLKQGLLDDLITGEVRITVAKQIEV